MFPKVFGWANTCTIFLKQKCFWPLAPFYGSELHILKWFHHHDENKSNSEKILISQTFQNDRLKVPNAIRTSENEKKSTEFVERKIIPFQSLIKFTSKLIDLS